MRRLVVCRILGGNCRTVGCIVHQGIDAVRAYHRSCNNVKNGRILRVTDNQFFAPVAKEVRHKARRIFGAVATCCGKSRRTIKVNFSLDVLRIELGHIGAIQKFIVGIAVKVNAEVLRNSRRTDSFVLDRKHSTALCRPHFVAAMGGVDIGSHATTIVHTWVRLRGSPDNFTVMGTEFIGVLSRRMFMNIPNFQTRAVRIHIANVMGIAMAKASTVAQGAIMIQSGRAKENFIIAIAIKVSRLKAVVTFAIESLARIFRLVVPALFQSLAIEIVCNYISRRVITTCKNCTRVDAIEIACRCQVAFAAVTIVVAPVALAILTLHMLVDVSARHKINRRDCSAIRTTEHRQIFRSLEHKTVAVTVILRLVANSFARTVNGTVSSLHNHFGLAVAIVVKHLELRVMSTCADVLAKVNAPQALTVELIGIDKHRTRITRL